MTTLCVFPAPCRRSSDGLQNRVVMTREEPTETSRAATDAIRR